MRPYLSFFKLRFATGLQYRFSAIAGLATQFFWGIMMIFIYEAFYQNGVSTPMNLSNLVTYMWLGQAFFALTHPYQKDSELLEMIKNGNIAYELIRPQNFYFKFYIKMLANRIVTTIQRCFTSKQCYRNSSSRKTI